VIAAVAAFAATNVDDLFLLVAWFAAGRYRPGDIVLGQYLGIGALFAASLAAAVLAWSVPLQYLAWLGVLPILVGLGMLLRGEGQEKPVPPASGVVAVTSVTIANGADNLGVYIPLFATSRGTEIAVMAAAFAAMTALWCVAARWLVLHPAAALPVRRHGPRLVPYVLIALGFWILAGLF
jgi:cadmium resistance protein CadD (predicted permease)